MNTNAPNIIETLDYETIFAARKKDFIARFPEAEQAAWQDTLALESEPVTKLLEVIAYLELLLRARVNEAARANLLAFARDKDLDRLADFYGLNRFQGEADDAFRMRLITRIQGSSTAGPAAHYRAHALSAHPAVEDVHIASPNPGKVIVAILAKHDQADALDAVREVVLSNRVRVLSDSVSVVAAKTRIINIQAQITLNKNAPVNIREQLSQRVQTLINSVLLGENISQSAIIAALHQSGVNAVNLIEPTQDIVIADDEVAILGEVQIEVIT